MDDPDDLHLLTLAAEQVNALKPDHGRAFSSASRSCAAVAYSCSPTT
jgi:hypothetical protein